MIQPLHFEGWSWGSSSTLHFFFFFFFFFDFLSGNKNIEANQSSLTLRKWYIFKKYKVLLFYFEGVGRLGSGFYPLRWGPRSQRPDPIFTPCPLIQHWYRVMFPLRSIMRENRITRFNLECQTRRPNSDYLSEVIHTTSEIMNWSIIGLVYQEDFVV